LKTSSPFKQEDFIRAFLAQGLTYTQAERAHRGLLRALESALINRQEVFLGRVGKLQPRQIPPRQYAMRCRRKKGGQLDPRIYEFTVGSRTRFHFKLFEAFGRRHGLR
jgi:hypothetical protein